MTAKLFETKSLDGNANDPYLISPKGIKVQVPEARVLDLLRQGFTLVDKFWRPTEQKKPEEPFRDAPLPMTELKKETAKLVDELGVIEI